MASSILVTEIRDRLHPPELREVILALESRSWTTEMNSG